MAKDTTTTAQIMMGVVTEDANIRKPYFSLGDFIVHSGMSIVKPFRATKDYVSMWATNKDKVYDKWVPRNGELCWFYSDHTTIPFLSRFYKMEGKQYYSLASRDDEELWEFCEPFVHTVPDKFTHLYSYYC